MNAQCAKCGTLIRIDESRLGERGARIRCPSCAATVVVERPRPPEPELLGDDDLVLVDADAEVGTGRPASPGLSGAETRVGSPPNLARAPGRGVPVASTDGPAGATRTAVGAAPLDGLDDDLYAGGGLAADGTLIPPRAELPRASAPRATPDADPRELELAEDVRPLARASRTGRPSTGRRPRVRRSVLATVGNVAGSLLALALLGFGVLVFLGGGRIDARLLRLDRGALEAAWPSRPVVELDGVRVESMRAFTYPTRSGAPVLVFAGEVRNLSPEPRRDLVVVAELRDAAGRLVASERGPVGVALTPFELSRADDPAALSAAMAVPDGQPLAPGAQAPFTAVFAHVPPQLASLAEGVRLARVEPRRVEPPPAEVQAPRVEPQPRGKVKGKGRAKGRARARRPD